MKDDTSQRMDSSLPQCCSADSSAEILLVPSRAGSELFLRPYTTGLDVRSSIVTSCETVTAALWELLGSVLLCVTVEPPALVGDLSGVSVPMVDTPHAWPFMVGLDDDKEDLCVF